MKLSRQTWIIFILISLSCIPITLHFFPHAFPILSVNITMNRTQALEQARDLAQQYKLVPHEFDQAAIFHLDDNAKTFIELDGGGKDALTNAMQENLFMPYTWMVRHFRQGNPRAALIRFKPDGTPYGFEQDFSEDDPGAKLSSDDARAIAEKHARDAWQIDLNLYTPIETAQETKPSGRIDHTFVYERNNHTIGEHGSYRLRLGVSGDQFSTLTHVVYIPETFTRRYEEMRSANDIIANVAYQFYYLFYFLGGCILALLWLLRSRWLIIRTPLYWAAGIALLLALTQLNKLPIIWIMYDTALPAQDFLLSYLASIFNQLVRTIIPLALAFIAAESLTRKAFGTHPQLWRVWELPNAASRSIASSTIAAYLLVPFDFAFISLFYTLTITHYGWWIPSSQFFDPNILATYVPWLEPCVMALLAGFREECLFRAIPIAGAALIGDRIGKRNGMITFAFIVQALVFSAAHANYPGLPAYARLVELIIPSLGFAWIYLRYGLLTVVIWHTVYDIVWMALPLFISHAPNAWINQLMTIIIALIPLWIVLIARLRNNGWTTLANDQRNSAWQAPDIAITPPLSDDHYQTEHTLSPLVQRGLLIAGLCGIPLWFYTTNFHNDALPLKVSRNEAVTIAREYAERHNMHDDQWYPIITINADDHDMQQRFVWQHTDPETYQTLLRSYLIPPRWLVRFVRFDGELNDRAEEYRVGVREHGDIHGFFHMLPQSQPGASPSVDKAREQVHRIIFDQIHLDPTTLKEIEAAPIKQPERTDWQFVLSDPDNYSLSEGQGRILTLLAGDLFSRLLRFVHVPEAWQRADRSLLNKTQTIQIICSILFYLLTLLAAFALARTRRLPFNFAVWRKLFLFLLLMSIASLALSWNELIAAVNTSEPFYNQLVMTVGMQLINILVSTTVLSVLTVSVTNIAYRYSLSPDTRRKQYALALGCIIAGLVSSIERLRPSLIPYWAQYGLLNSLAPAITACIQAIIQFLTIGAALFTLYALVDYLTTTGKRNVIAGSLCMILFALCAFAQEPIYSMSYWLCSSIALGCVITAAYYLLLRFDRALLPLVILPLIAGEYLQQMAMNAFYGSISTYILATACCIFIAYFWTHAFETNAEVS